MPGNRLQCCFFGHQGAQAFAGTGCASRDARSWLLGSGLVPEACHGLGARGEATVKIVSSSQACGAAESAAQPPVDEANCLASTMSDLCHCLANLNRCRPSEILKACRRKAWRRVDREWLFRWREWQGRDRQNTTQRASRKEREREIMLAPHPRMPAQQTCGWAWSPGVLESERERQRERDGAAPGGVGTACPSCPRAKQSKTERERERESERSSSESPEIGLVAI